jgi:phosphate transport system substrate-binding protein
MKRTTLIKTLIIMISVCCFAGSALAETIDIKGSTTVLPIAQKAAEAFMKVYPDVNVSVSGGGSGNGIKAIIDGTTHIGNASRFIKTKEVALAVEKGVYPVPFGVAYDCIVPVVHPKNAVADLTLDQLKSIYEGKAKSWKAFGGPDKEIVVISRDTSSGTYEVWEEKIMNKARVYPGALLQASNGAVAQAVSKNQYAIGYVGLSYLNDDLKPLTVGGVVGNQENALNSSYPVSRVLYMFTQGWPTGMTLKFINFVMHPEKGQKIVAEAGYVPLY